MIYMDLFKTKEGIYTESDFERTLAKFNLKGRNLYLCSSLLSLGRPTNLKVPGRIIEILLDILGKEGTLTIPAYTFSAYSNEIFDVEKSRSITGVLGETARLMPGFTRTVHPVYSHAVKGKHAEFLDGQDFTTCFGENSYFDLFCSIPDSYVMVLGSSLSALAFYHYYDQLFNAPGRFVKKFKAKIQTGCEVREIEFDSYVKDYDNFYVGNLMNCLGRFDALATELGLLHREPVGMNCAAGISEPDFKRLYKSCLDTDQKYFLCSTKEEWQEYFPKNNYSLFHGEILPEKLDSIRLSLQAQESLD